MTGSCWTSERVIVPTVRRRPPHKREAVLAYLAENYPAGHYDVPDKVIAARLGVSIRTVIRARSGR